MSPKQSVPTVDDRFCGNKMIFGAQELVYIKEAALNITSRIDTGANYSSISAINIRHFERDGRKFVRFDIVANDKTVTVEAPYVKSDSIRQVQSDTVQVRPIVRLTVKIGEHTMKTDFTLSDRRRMQFPLLVGRTLLNNLAIVDVSRLFVQGNPTISTPIVLPRDDYLKAKSNGQSGVVSTFKQDNEVLIAYPAVAPEEKADQNVK